MLEQYDEHRLGNSVAVAARIIYRLSKLVPDNMDRSGLFSIFSKVFSFVRAISTFCYYQFL